MIQPAEKFRKSTVRPDYKPKAPIAGVRFIELRRFVDEGGDLCETARFDGGRLLGFDGFEVRQTMHSVLQPGAVKAWHYHRSQTDLWYVPGHERALVGLLDVRKGSATEGVSQRVVLGDGQARLLVIPPGVAHGCANLGSNPVNLFYFVDRAFDPANHDEQRLPADAAGTDFWTIRPG